MAENKKICVFGAASNKINQKYIDIAEELGYKLGKHGCELIFGAGKNGLMGASARGFKKADAKITGVIPTFFKEDTIEAIYEDCDELIFTETMRERKKTMEDMADCFIIVPGGIGTFEEFFEVLTLKQLARHRKKIVIYNINGFYDRLIEFLEFCSAEGFICENINDLYIATTDENELFDYIDDDTSVSYSVHDLKNG